MIRKLFQKLATLLTQFLQAPGTVLLVCIALLVAGLVFDGSLLRLWRLHRDAGDLEVRIERMQTDTQDLENKIKRAEDPHFIELQARERLDLAQEGDLVFVFSDKD